MHKPNSPFLAYIYELMIMSRYSMSTIEAYLHWIIGYIRFNQLRHPGRDRTLLMKFEQADRL